jgi:hypothetical protein
MSNSLSRGADEGQPSGVGEITLPTRTKTRTIRELRRGSYSHDSATMLLRHAWEEEGEEFTTSGGNQRSVRMRVYESSAKVEL